MTDIKIDVTESKVILFAPYHTDLPKKARNIGGQWTGAAWYFDKRDEERVRKLAREVYGYGEPTVTVRYLVTGNHRDHDVKELWLFGRQVAARPSRDAAVRLGEGVIIVDGKFPGRGGSAKYPSITSGMTEPVTLEIRDVPVNLIAPDNELVEIMEDMPKTNCLGGYSDDELLAEVKRRGLTT